MPQVRETQTITSAPQQRQNKGGLVGFLGNAISGNWPGAAASLLGVPELETLATAVTGTEPKKGTAPAEAPQPSPESTATQEPAPNLNQIPLQAHILNEEQFKPQLLGTAPGVPQAPPPTNPNPLPGVPPFQMPGMQSPQQPMGFYTPPPYHLMQKYGNWWGSQS